MNKAIIAKNAPAAVGPYVHAVQAGNLLFVSGQLGLDPVSGDLKEGLEAQAVQALENMKAVLNEAGYELTDVVKTTVFIDNRTLLRLMRFMLSILMIVSLQDHA